MKVALTGATGFLGRYIAARFLGRGDQLRAWVRPGAPPPGPERFGGEAAIEWIPGRLGERDASRTLCDGAQVVIHAGHFRGGPSFMEVTADPEEYFRVNVLGAVQLIEGCREQGVNRFLFVSSGAVHQRVLEDRRLDESHPLWPKSLYGAAKASVETLISAYGRAGDLDCCAIRPTSIYGIADPLAASKWFDLARRVAGGGRVEVSGGAKSVHAADVAGAIELLATTDAAISGEVFNCTDRMISDHQVATIARRLSGSDAELVGVPRESKHAMDTSKLEGLGMRFGGTARLEATIAELLES